MTSKKVNVDFCLPECSATKVMSCKCHVDNKTNSRYDMILGRGLITAMGLDLKYSENLIIGGAGPYELCLVPMADLSNYGFKSLAENIVKPE